MAELHQQLTKNPTRCGCKYCKTAQRSAFVKQHRLFKHWIAVHRSVSMLEGINNWVISRAVTSKNHSAVFKRILLAGAFSIVSSTKPTGSKLLCDFIDSHISSQHFRNYDRSVRLLIIFKNGCAGSSNCKAGTIECMNKFRFAL